ncbi:G-type lectin S-receptor-like serine/threonine-protein kinase RLK1 [Morus notabilis]|uniref:Receptor-like serine/threonine-protein kinase n=1 Tax=Morus notabilis TaxID=981085 RepID=W9SAT2_9ROSA|nr:G-type lectin S-receptor-like serine/threonine-protein kinase LECRK3 [Morus notabilis]EXC19916.1 G-type lectin S-receptor-like serine/threonine-protein kinase RLK1 [Morus notabilis]
MAIILLFFLLLTKFSKTNSQQQNNQISLGSSLSAGTNNSFWLSDSGKFAFGFYQASNGSFSVGIWFEKIKEKTVIWTWNRDDKPQPRETTLLLSGDGRLVLRDAQGMEILVYSNTSQPATSASMLDSGNFVLYSLDSKIIWQSFDYPTDTLLPEQRLEAGEQLVSSVSTTNHSSGRFQLRMQRDGNLVQYPTDSPILSFYSYWASDTYDKGNGVSLNLDINGQVYLLNSTGFNVKTIFAGENNLSDNVVYRLTIDVDGILRLYSHSLVQNSSWVVEWYSVESKCTPLGLCGLNSYCVLGDDEEPNCECLPGFDLIDQRQGSLGCKRNLSTSCTSKNQNTLSVAELDGFIWENNSYSMVSAMSKNACKEECLRDYNCQVALFRNQQCNKLMSPLNYAKLPENGFATTIIKVCNGSSGTSTTILSKGRNGQVKKAILISSLSVSSFGVIVLAIFVTLTYRLRIREYKMIANQRHVEFLEDVTLQPYTFAELEKATNGFTDQVGKGAFGTVFKGVLISNNCRKVVAIKRLEKVIADGEREFRNEMKVIGKTHHRNLVKLLGYCHEETNRLLVYKYVENGSLADFLFGNETKPTWEERVRIALNIARGIHYLHEECETQIIHCDIKPENILMDEQNRAKIADFGLSKLLIPDQTRTYTGFRGTRGYVAPEWHRNMPITVKADVYSFGIVLLEIICCRRSVDMDVPEDKVVLANWVYDCFLDGELDKLVEDEDVEENELQKMIKLGLWCIQEEPSVRPSMKKVCLMLEGTIEIPTPPSPTSSVSNVQID